MSIAFEAPEIKDDPVETALESHELAAWFADSDKQANEDMPELSELSLNRLDGQIGDDQKFDFMSVMTNLYDITDKEQQQAIYLYICGYSEQDLELMAPEFTIQELANQVASWHSRKPAVHVVPDRAVMTSDEKPSVLNRGFAVEKQNKPEQLQTVLVNLFRDILDEEQLKVLPGFTDAQKDFVALEMGKIYRDNVPSQKLINRYISHMRRFMRGSSVSTVASEDGLSHGTVYNAFSYKLPPHFIPHKLRIVQEFERLRTLPINAEGPSEKELLFDDLLSRQIGRSAILTEISVNSSHDETDRRRRNTRSGDEENVASLDPVREYLNGIGKIALLNAEDEVDLAKRIEAGLYAGTIIKASDKDAWIGKIAPRNLNDNELRDLLFIERDGTNARQHLLEANLRLVVSLAKRYTASGMPLLDLIQEGNLGLIRAVEKFDYAKGFKFSTYATWWIRQAITRGIAEQKRTIRLPVHVVEQVNKLTRMKREMEQTLGREASIEELSLESGIAIEKLADLITNSREAISTDMPVGSDEEESLGSFIADIDMPSPEDAVVEMALADDMQAVLESLTERQAFVLRHHYGLIDGMRKTYNEIGKLLGVSGEEARKIELRGLDKIRETSRIDKLESYSKD